MDNKQKIGRNTMNYKKLNMLFLLSAVSGAFLVQNDAQAAANQALPFKCTLQICRQSFATRRELTTHMRTHAQPRPVQDERPNVLRCIECGNDYITFYTRELLNNHLRENHPRVRVMQVGRPAAGQRRQGRRENQNGRLQEEEEEEVRQGLEELQIVQQQQQLQGPAVMQGQQQPEGQIEQE